jgi:hypothetical protein
MLEGIRSIYEKVATNLLPDWKDIDKNDLIRKACEYENGPYKDAYVAAIMLKYWNKIPQFYYKCKLVTTPEDVHTWLTTAVMYALNKQPWNNPESTIYNDPNGPDKVVNRGMESRRVTFYQQLNRFNRRINSDILSLDTLVEDYKDVFIPESSDSYAFEHEELVQQFFNKKDYFMAFMIDAIFYEGVVTDTLNKKKLLTHLRHLDKNFFKRFSKTYNIPTEDVQKAATYVTQVSAYKMKTKIEYNLLRLKKVIQEGE